MENFSETVKQIQFGRQDCSDLHSWSPGIREIYIIHYILRGKGYLICEEKNMSCVQDRAF